MSLQLSHFSAAVLFALFAAVVFGITQRSTPREQVKYGLQCFAYFVGGVFAAGWVMWILRR
jgi:H+/gluconate symporter-like permease